MPARHSAQTLAPDTEKLPLEQLLHAEPPSRPLKVPAIQALHEVCLVPPWNAPAGHRLQTEPPALA